nr:protein FRA10AC1 isoform X3 [Oryctolagus cuniculus]
MHGHGGYDSDFSDDEHCGESSKRKKRIVEDDLLLKKPFQKEKHGKVAHKQVAAELLDREEARNRRFHLIAMDAYQRHTKFVNDYILYYGGKKEDFRRLGENDKTDLDVIRENHKFLWNEEDEVDMTWEKRLAKKYYDKLFKEYCIADLSRYKENKGNWHGATGVVEALLLASSELLWPSLTGWKFGFRWRVEKEVISGKGQFFCGNKYCDEKEGLKSWEVNFGYIEHGEKRNALVKLSRVDSERERQRERSSFAVGSPSNGRRCSRRTALILAGARRQVLFLVSHGVQGPSTWAILHCTPWP